MKGAKTAGRVILLILEPEERKATFYHEMYYHFIVDIFLYKK